VVAHDLGPNYLSTEYALAIKDVRLIEVQHHFAHVASCMAEHGETGRVLGVVYDSMGYGDDGTIWGAEFLAVEPGGYEHLGRLEQFRWPGRGKTASEPWRAALALIYNSYGYQTSEIASEIFRNIPKLKLKSIYEIVSKSTQMPLGSSMGRLFDAVAAITGVCTINNYEGQAPRMLESVVSSTTDEIERKPYLYEINYDKRGRLIVELAKIIFEVVEDLSADKPAVEIALRFHETVVALTVEACCKLREKARTNKVVLTGGVFQNRYITERLVEILPKEGFTVLTHSIVPPNNSGLSVGQAYIARALTKTS